MWEPDYRSIEQRPVWRPSPVGAAAALVGELSARGLLGRNSGRPIEGSEGTIDDERRAGAVPPTDNGQMEKSSDFEKFCKKTQKFPVLHRNVYIYKHSKRSRRLLYT